MDEYTFIVLAKLKADRLRLERQKDSTEQAAKDELTVPTHRSRRARWSSPDSPEIIPLSLHGMRGWS